MTRFKTFMIGLGMILGLAGGGTAFAEEGSRYAVTITNLTKGQVLTPPVVATHGKAFSLFAPGMPASPEMSALAEDGMTGPLMGLLASLPEVYESVAASGPILPGGSVTVEISAEEMFNRISVAGMLATTNDGFFALHGVKIPRKDGETFLAAAYDAGSEGNSESCAYIPGPPCGNGGVRDTGSAEGFVHVHSGIHGIGDLDPAMHDWNNPVAEVTVRRLD